MFITKRRFYFYAEHDRDCDGLGERTHAHHYTVEVSFCSPCLQGDGTLLPYNFVREFGRYISERCDNKSLEREFGDSQAHLPEALAEHFYHWVSIKWECESVTVDEGAHHSSTYRRDLPSMPVRLKSFLANQEAHV